MMSGNGCISCRNELRVGAKFCPKCGATQVAVGAPTPPGTTPFTPLVPVVQQPMTVPIQATEDLGVLHQQFHQLPVDGTGRKKSKWPMLLVGTLLVGAVGALAWFFLLAPRGGASSPEEAVRKFAEAVAGDDPLLIVDAVAPSEVEGVAELLEVLQARFGEQVLPTDGEPAGIDFNFQLDDVTVIEESDNAALMEISGSVTIDKSALTGPLGDVLDDTLEIDLGEISDRLDDEFGIDAITVAAVKEDGGWYVSPYMTAANFVTLAAELPEGELDRAGEAVERAAENPTEAVETMIEALGDFDVEQLSTVVSPGVTRLLLVYQDAFDELVDEIHNQNISVTDIDVEPSEIDSDHLALDSLHLVAGDLETSDEVTIKDDCVTTVDFDGNDDKSCLYEGLEADLAYDGIVFVTSSVDGGVVVDPVASLSAILADFIQNVDSKQLFDALDLEVLDTPQKIAIGKEYEVSFKDRPYAVLEYQPTQDELYDVSVFGDYSDSFEVSQDLLNNPFGDDDAASTESGTAWWTSDGQPVRLVVEGPKGDCGPVFCEYEEGDGATVVVGHATSQHIGGVFTNLTSDLNPGAGYRFDFDVTEFTAASLNPEPSDLRINLYNVDTGDYAYAESLEPGHYEMHVWNDSDRRIEFRIRPEQLDQANDQAVEVVAATGVFDPVLLDLGTYASAVGQFAPGAYVTVQVSPQDGQDIVLYVTSDNDDFCGSGIDSEVGGGMEWCTTQVGSNGEIFVEVVPYGDSDGYGTILVEIYPA
jgi:hypothetical protein